MITVQLPGGGTAQFPDGMPPADIERVLQQQFGGTAAPPPNPYEDGNAVRLSGGPGVKPPMQNDLMTSTAATISGIVNGIPVLGPMAQKATDNIMGMGSQLMGGNYDETVQGLQDRRAQIAEAAPIASFAGELGGNVASIGGLGSAIGNEALGLGGKLLPGLLNAGASNQAIYTADQMARGKSGMDTLGYGIPALIGAGSRLAGEAANKVGDGIAGAMTKGAQKRLTDTAIKGAPAADDLAQASRAMFQQVDNSGVTVDTNKFSEFVQGIVSKVKKERINPTLNPKSTGAFQELIGALDDVQRNGGALTLSDLHTLRQIAQDAAIKADPRDARFANMIVDGLDDFITTPGATRLPTNQIGDGATAAGNELLKAISTWGRSKRVGMIEEAIFKAQNQASGLENGLRTQFRAILQNPKKRAMFTKAELQAIEQVANGTGISNLTRLAGMFGFDFGSGRNMVGGSIGALVGGIPGVLAASGARKLSETMGRKGAERAARVVATPNIPVAPQAQNLLAPAQTPLEILIRGGAMTAGN